MSALLKKDGVRRFAREHGKRLGKDFLRELDGFVEEKVRAACDVHNGGKKTLDATVAVFVGIRSPRV